MKMLLLVIALFSISIASAQTPDSDSFRQALEDSLAHIEPAPLADYSFNYFSNTLSLSPALFRQPYTRLTEDEQVAIMAYTGPIYRELNRKLRDQIELGSLAAVSEILSQGLKKLPDYEGDVFRTVNLNESAIAAYREGTVIPYLAYTSTSIGKPLPQFGRLRILIHSHHGKDMHFLSVHPDEREVIFLPGTLFKVVKGTESSPSSTIELDEIGV